MTRANERFLTPCHSYPPDQVLEENMDYQMADSSSASSKEIRKMNTYAALTLFKFYAESHDGLTSEVRKKLVKFAGRHAIASFVSETLHPPVEFNRFVYKSPVASKSNWSNRKSNPLFVSASI